MRGRYRSGSSLWRCPHRSALRSSPFLPSRFYRRPRRPSKCRCGSCKVAECYFARLPADGLVFACGDIMQLVIKINADVFWRIIGLAARYRHSFQHKVFLVDALRFYTHIQKRKPDHPHIYKWAAQVNLGFALANDSCSFTSCSTLILVSRLASLLSRWVILNLSGWVFKSSFSSLLNKIASLNSGCCKLSEACFARGG
jgi:hypothetical protein